MTHVFSWIFCVKGSITSPPLFQKANFWPMEPLEGSKAEQSGCQVVM